MASEVSPTRGLTLTVAGRADAFALPSDDGSAPHLVGIRCLDCSAVGFPSTRACPRCAGQRVEEIPLSRRGVLHTWSTVVQDPGPNFVGTRPYTIVTVELPEGVHVVGTLCEPPPATGLCRGQAVETDFVEVDRTEDGRPIFDFRFRIIVDAIVDA